MQRAKRALALALVFALVASFCVTGAAADGGQTGQTPEELGYVKNDNAVTTDDDVIVSKTAKYVSENEYEITLEVTIPDAQVTVGSSADIVLVIDTSGSMNYCADCGGNGTHESSCSRTVGRDPDDYYWDWGYYPIYYVHDDDTRLYAAKESAKSFVDQLLGEGEEVNARIGIVSYETTADVACELSRNAYEIKGDIGYLNANGGTNIQAGIHEARQMLESSPAANKYIVVLSDGEPTYSYPVKGTSGWRGCEEGRRGSHYWNDDGYGWGEPADINLPSADEVTENDFDYDAEDPTGSGSSYDSGVYALLDVTCEHDRTRYDYEYYGDECPFDNNGDPAIAEAGFAKADDCTIYSIYFGTPSDNAEHTMLGISNGKGYYSSAANGNALQGIFDSIAGDVIETSAGAVTDPMGDNITLGDVSDLADDGVSVSDDRRTLNWNPTNGRENEDGSTTYTVTYPITVDGEDLTASGWVAANDTTTFTYEVNGVDRTANFSVPQVWGEKPVTEREQNVYVFVKVTGSGENGALTSDDEQRIEQMGLDSLNKDGWYTIGVTTAELPLASGATEKHNYYSQYGTAVNVNSLDHELPANKSFNEKDTSITWNELVVAYGANEYSEGSFENTDYYAPDENLCWHLNGVITLTALEEQFVDVTYDANGGTGKMNSQTVPKGSDVTLRKNEYELEGHTFTGWNTAADGSGYDYIDGDTVYGLEEDLTLYAQWSRNTSSITIEVYVDGEPVTLTEENLSDYITELTDGANTPTWEDTVEDGVIKGTYNYQNYDSADIVLTPNGKYVLQGIKGTFIKGQDSWKDITQSGNAWTIDNVKGGTTLSVYLNTKYSVEYEVPSSLGPAPTDPNTYITVEGLENADAPSFGSGIDPNEGVSGGWTNNNLETTINLKTVPTGTTGWYDELTQTTGLHEEGETIIVADAVAAELNGDDNTFTFRATANEYTVTYHANTSADDTTSYIDPNTVTHGGSYTVLGNDTTNFNNTGYTFAGWATSENGDVIYQAGNTINITTNVDLYAKWTAITGTLTVTKTVEGLEGNDTLPSNFSITVTGPDSFSRTLTLDGTTPVDGVYTWEIENAPYGEYTITETNANVSGYALQESSVTEAKAEINDESGDTAELKNVYVKDAPGLDVVKTVYSVGDATGENIPSEVKVGDVIVYKIVVTNTGNVALENISVTDTLGDQTLTVYTDVACESVAGNFDLAVDESEQFYAQYKVTADDAEAGFVKNTATASDGDTTGKDDITVDVKEQHKLIVEYYYDESSGEPFDSEEYTLNEGNSWSVSTVTGATHVAPETVTRVLDGANVNYMLDTTLPQSGTMGETDVTVDLVYVKDEWKDNPDGDSETGGDDIPDYRQALIVYEVAEGQDQMGGVSPTIDVVTLEETSEGSGVYSGEETAESTATPEDGSVFVEWSWTHDEDGPSTNATLSHEFTAEGGKEYVYTASFRAGNTDAEVTKTLVSYTRDGVTVEIPADFKARVGDVLNYAITIENTGEIALEDVTVSDTLWGNGVASAMVGETETNVSGGSCKVDVASGSSVTITYSYTVQAGDIGRTITNTATVDIDDKDPDEDPKDDEEVTVDDYSVTITPADIVAYTGGDGYSAVVGEDNQYINDSTSGLPEPGYHVVLSDAVVDWLNDNGVAAGDGLTDDATDLADVLSFTYNYGGKERAWSLQYVGVYSYNASGNPSAYVYSIVTETAGAPSVSLKYFDDLNEDGVAGVDEVITSDDILMSADQVNHTYKMTIEGGGLDQSQVKAVLKAGGKSLTTDIEIGIGELTVLSTTNEETTNSIAGSAAGVDSGVITAVGNDSITYYVNESGVSFNDEDLVSRVQLLIDEVTNETSGEFETAMAEAAFDAVSAALRNAEYEMCYMDLVDTENGNAKVTFSGGELSIYWPLPDGASASDSFYIVHFTELDREHDAVGTDVLDTTNKDVIAGEVMRIGGEYYVTFDVGSFSPFVLVYGDEGGGRPIIPVPDPDDGDDEEEEFVPKWLNIDDHYAYIIGYEDGTVRPQGNITRAEVATIFFRLLTDEVREEYWSTESGYSDVSSSDWYNNAISTLSNLGVITGYEDGTFRPNASISRAEFVTIATRFFDYTAEYEGTFSDVSYSSWYADFVQAAVDMGLVNGYENGTFRPNASITRAEAVAIVNRVLLRRPDAEHLLSWAVMNTFSDNADTAAWYYADIQEATNSHDYDWITYSGERIEDWTEKLEERDWAALEREWSSAYDAPGGEVTG